MTFFRSPFVRLGFSLLTLSAVAHPQQPEAKHRHNVIIFVADGLRRNSVTKEDMPTFLKLREQGVDYANSHSVFPTFTTANASVIATGHGLGDTGDYSNTLYPGVFLTKPDFALLSGEKATGSVVPFIESDELLADLNAVFHGNYMGERTLMSVAHDQGYQVASVGKAGPTAIQQIESVSWDRSGILPDNGAIIVDDQTGQKTGVRFSPDLLDAMRKAELAPVAPLRTNGYEATSIWSNGFSGNATAPGTAAANVVQEQWFTDVTTRVLLPRFTEAKDSKPFLLLFWSRDPDGTQHNQGDSPQSLSPGINGETARRGLQNADRCLKQLLDWLDAHPAIKADTDVLVTSDHGFATASRREIAPDVQTGEPSAQLSYELSATETITQKPGTLPTGFLSVDLGIRLNLRAYDPAVRAENGPSVYTELTRDGEKAQHPQGGSALLADEVHKLDGSDAKMIVTANGGSDMIYMANPDAGLVHKTLDAIVQLDYVGGVFVDDKFCPKPDACPGALPMSAVGLVGVSKVPRPAIVVNFKAFLTKPGDLQSTIQVSDSGLQEGQGQHGGLARSETFNNMAAIGPDFRKGFVDQTPMGNIDIVPTIAHILGIEMPSLGTLKGRVTTEALAKGEAAKAGAGIQTMISAPTANGARTMLEYEEANGVRYYDRACLVTDATAKRCP